MTVVVILVALAAVIALTALTGRRRDRREDAGEVSGPHYGADPAGPEAALGTRPAPLPPPPHQASQTLLAFAGMRALIPGDSRRERLRETLVQDHMRYAWHIATLYSSPADPGEVTFATARLSLTRAIDAYDPDSGTDFLTFATPLILREVRALRRGAGTGPHAPTRSRRLADALPASADRLARSLGRSPTIAELATALGVGTEEVVESLDTALGYPAPQSEHSRSGSGNLLRAHDPSSGPSSGPSPDATLGSAPDPSPDTALGSAPDTAPDSADVRRAEPPAFAAALTSEQLKRLLAPLSERNKRIVMMRYLRGMTDVQIGAELNISPVQVSRLLAQAMTALHAPDRDRAPSSARPLEQRT